MPFLDWISKPANQLEQPNGSVVAPQILAATVFALLSGYRGSGSSPRAAPHPDTIFQVTGTAVAAQASVTLATPPVSSMLMCAHLELSVSVAGSYQIFVGGTLAWDLDMLAATPLVLINCFPGVFLYTGNGQVTIKNNTAGPANIKATAVGKFALQ